MDLQKVYAEFKAADAKHDLEKMCNIILQTKEEYIELIQAEKWEAIPDLAKYCLYHTELLIYCAMKFLNEGKADKATICLLTLSKISEKSFIDFFHLRYLLGRALYQTGDYKTAEKLFYRYEETRLEQFGDFDELSMFYRANCCALLGDFNTAAQLYELILKMKANFPEAKKNFDIVRHGSNKKLVLEVKSLWKFTNWRYVPIFINARDRLGVMKKLIDWLLDAGYRNLIILDNNSTYPPLLEYYNNIERMRGGVYQDC